MTCCLYITVALDAMPTEKPLWALPCPPVPLCLKSIFCSDYTLLDRNNSARNIRWRALTCCYLEEVDKCNNPQSAMPLSDPQYQLTHPCLFTRAYPQPSASPQPQHLPSSRFSTHTNKPQRPCPAWLAHTHVLPSILLKLHASLHHLLFKYFIILYIQYLS